jgi:hypothetical protein
MKRVSAYRIHCQGLGPVPGLYTSQSPADHIAAWAAKDVAVFGETSKHGKRWVVKVEAESLYVDGECEAHFADASHPDELRPPPPPSASKDGPAELGAVGFGTVTNP